MSRENVDTLRDALASGRLPLSPSSTRGWSGITWGPSRRQSPTTVRSRWPASCGSGPADFDDFGFEADQLIDAGPSVLALLHQWGRGKDTGAQVESHTWQVFDFRGGKVVHCRGYPTKAEALEAAGLSE